MLRIEPKSTELINKILQKREATSKSAKIAATNQLSTYTYSDKYDKTLCVSDSNKIYQSKQNTMDTVNLRACLIQGEKGSIKLYDRLWHENLYCTTDCFPTYRAVNHCRCT